MPPLCGYRVVNTRAVHQARELDQLLNASGAIPVPYPCIEISPPADASHLRDALARLGSGEFDWLVLTSRNTVHVIAPLLGRLPSGLRVAAVGSATASMAQAALNVEVDVVPDHQSGAELARHMPVQPGDQVLIPSSDLAGRELADVLTARGATVERVIAYRTTTGKGGANLPTLLTDGQIDAVAFCSSSAVDGFVARMSAEGGPPAASLEPPVVCIGDSTLSTALSHGFRSATAAADQSLNGLIVALTELLLAHPQGGHR